jgi:hypothetical protein
MSKQTKNFIEFNGENIYFVNVLEIDWIAIKPICKALNLDYNIELENLKEHKFLNEKFSQQMIINSTNSNKIFLCLPEHLIPCWLFSINPELINLKRYDIIEIIFKSFHGPYTRENINNFMDKYNLKNTL